MRATSLVSEGASNLEETLKAYLMFGYGNVEPIWVKVIFNEHI